MEPQATLDTLHRLMIRREVALWFASGRAIHAWHIRRICRQAKWPVPEEIETYLDACAERLCAADLATPKQVAEAFELDGPGRKASVSSNQLAAAEHVFALKAIHPDRPITRIFEDVALHLNAQRADGDKDAESFVRNAYYAWLKAHSFF